MSTDIRILKKAFFKLQALYFKARQQRDSLRRACEDALEFFEETGRGDMAVAVMLREKLQEAAS